MIDNNCGVFRHAFRSLENDVVILQCVGGFLDSRGASSCGRVCITFFKVFNENQEIWTQVSLNEGVPFVVDKDRNRKGRNRKADFQTLYPLTFSGAMISRTIGEVVGEIPCISEVAFNRLNASDPFEQKKLMKATWVLVVIPSYIKRTAGPQFPFDVDSKGNLIEVPVNQVQNGKELVFSCSLENIRLSGSYPLKGRENMPIFHEDSLNEVFDQCGASSDKTSVYFMRRYIVEESRALAYVKQKQLVEKYGFGVTPTRIRALFHAIDILEFGTCSDVSKPQATCARGPETVLLGWDSYSVAIGFFTLKSGVEVFNCDAARDSVGVAPGIPLEEVL